MNIIRMFTRLIDLLMGDDTHYEGHCRFRNEENYRESDSNSPE